MFYVPIFLFFVGGPITVMFFPFIVREFIEETNLFNFLILLMYCFNLYIFSRIIVDAYKNSKKVKTQE